MAANGDVYTTDNWATWYLTGNAFTGPPTPVVHQLRRAQGAISVRRNADADRVFLRDFTSLTFKNRMVAVQALLHAGKNSVPHAVAYLRHENPALSEAEAIGTEARIQERARFQAIMFAKIFGEFVGAVEDVRRALLCNSKSCRGGNPNPIPEVWCC